MTTRRAFGTLATLALLALLGGCATRWVVDSDVSSFSKLSSAQATAGAAYRFERLPSQAEGEAARDADALEAMAAPALERAGLRRDDARARFSVQVGARVTPTVSAWSDPWFGPGWGPAWGPGPGWGRGYGRGAWYGAGGYGPGWYGPGFPPHATPWYAREVSLVMRELPSNQVVYETRARNDGPYSTDAAVLPVMFQAALQGFPTPPAGERRVNVEIPQKAAQP